MLLPSKRFFRYLAPNLVTVASLAFGLLSILSTIEGRYQAAAWFVIYAVLTDKLDGFVARLVKGTSEFGVQLDSFADFLNFGIAPAALWYAFLTRAPDLPFAEGAGHFVLLVGCLVWVLSVTFRLARYNVVGDEPACKRVFFGVPTTLMGGVLIAFFLACLKYGPADISTAMGASFSEPRLLGDLHLGRIVWETWPVHMIVGGLMMVSTIRVPKLGPKRSRFWTAFVFANVFAGYSLGFARRLPEYLCFPPSLWIFGSIIWSSVSAGARDLRAPAVFPRDDRPGTRVPFRPEEEVVDDDASDDEDDEAAEVTPSARG